MTDLLPRGPELVAFLCASFILAVTPGPAVLYIVARSLTQGRRSGLASAAGVALGNLGNAIGAAVGLATWFSVSSLAFTIAKYAGAGYLIYLAVQTAFSTRQPAEEKRLAPAPPQHIFLDAFWVALFNPKTALFFAAFLPQFMGLPVMPVQQVISMGFVFVLIASTTDAICALAAGTISHWVQQGGRGNTVGRGLKAGVFLGLGLYTAFGEKLRSAR
jgi:threonine/homoserine/homoserine lactone efflux protein